MRLDDFIQTAMNNVLKNPALSVSRDINFSSILEKKKTGSNFIKRMWKITILNNFTFFLYVYH